MADYDAQLNVGVIVDQKSAVNQFANIARSIESRPIKVNIASNQALGVMARDANNFNRALEASQARILSFGISAGQIFLVARAFDGLLRSTIDVQKQLTDINVVLNLSSGQLNQFSTKLFQAANLTGQSFKIASETALQFARQGLGVSEVLKRTADAMALARIGGLDLDTSIKTITATLNTFNEVGLTSTVLLNKISSVDTNYAAAGNVISQALLKVSAVAQDANVSLDKTIGIITALQTRTSRGGDVIGTSLATIFQRIERPQVLEQLQQLGVATEDLSGKSLSADIVLTNLAKTYDKLSDAQKNAVTQSVSGLRNANQFKAILSDLASPNSITGRAANTSANATDSAARRQLALNQTLAAQFNAVKNNLTQVAAEIGNISLAPALNNIFKGVNLVTQGDSLSKGIGEGLLKGLGNYLSGPGLALGATLITKFFLNFSTYAAKSLAGIIENSSTRLQLETKVGEILDKQPQILQQIANIQNQAVSAAEKEVQVQTLITAELLKQSTLQNIRGQAVQSVSSLVGSVPILGSKSTPFALNNAENAFTKNAKFVPNNSALSDAIDRERRSGIDVSQIRVGQSGQLVSSDNPLGIGIYNTKDEPLGLNQGINRVAQGGGDIKKAGAVPNFANNPFPFLPGQFPQTSFNPVIPPTFDIRSLVPQRVLNGPTPDLPEKLEFEFSQAIKGAFSNLGQNIPKSSNVNDFISNLKRQNPTAQLSASLTPDKVIAPSDINKKIQDTIGQSKFGSNPITLTQNLNKYINSVKKNFINPLDEAHTKLLKSFEEASVGYGPQFQSIVSEKIKGLQDSLTSSPQNQQLIAQQQRDEQNRVAQQLTKEAETKLNSLNIFDATIGQFSSKFTGAVSFAQKNAPASLNATRQRLAGQGLVGSFVAPIAAGLVQQGLQSTIGNDSTATRGASASVGAAGNIASFALGGLAFGPEGAAVGAGIGLLTQLPSVFKAFTDTLPDLQRNLDKVKEATTRSNDAFSTFISVSQKLAELNNPNNPERSNVSAGQYNELLRQQNESKQQIPPEFRSKISTAIANGDFSTAYDLQNIAQLNGSQTQNLISDTGTLRSKNGGFLKSIGASNDFINKQGSDFAQGNGILNILSKLGTTGGNDALSYLSLRSGGNENIIGNTTSNSRADRDLLINAGVALKGGNSGSGGLKDESLTALDIFNKLQSYVQDNLQQPVNELLDLTNNKGSSLAELLKNKPADITTPANLEKYLNANNFDSQKTSSAKDFLTGFLQQGSGASDFISSATSSKAINNRFGDQQKLQEAADNTAKIYNDLNERLAKLSTTGAEAVQAFEINVVDRLSASLTSLRSVSITSDTIARKSEINSGNNDFNKTYFDFVKQNNSAQNQYGEQVTNINTEFTKDIGNILVSQVSNLVDKMKQSVTSKNTDPSKFTDIINSRINNLNEVFGDTAKIDSSGVRTVNPNIDINSINSVKDRLNKQISNQNQVNQVFPLNSLAIAQSYLSGGGNLGANLQKASGTDTQAKTLLSNINSVSDTGERSKILSLTPDTFKAYQDYLKNIPDVLEQDNELLDILNKQSVGISTKLEEAKNILNSNLQLNSKQLFANYDILSAQFKSDQSNSLFSGNLNRQFSASAFDLSRQAQISNPVQAIGLNAQSQLQPQIANILDTLNQSTKLGITNPNDIQGAISKQRTIFNSVTASGGDGHESLGNIEELTRAETELDKARQDSIQRINQEIQSLSKFTDVQAGLVLQKNINSAGQGTLTGADFGRAALAPLQYNSQTFNRDAITGLQEFSSEVKDDLGKNLLSATQGAKNASEAFRDLGLSLAQSLETKAVDIGINSLFGAATSGASSLFKGFSSNAKGGYIPKFARGGFVNMGSGTKDDVPAYLSGGEFVINRNAVSKIGKNNLDALNNSPHFADGGTFQQPSQFRTSTANARNRAGLRNFQGVTSDTINDDGNSADITLANAFTFKNGSNGTKGNLNTSSLLSSIGQSDPNDPQNKLKFSRQKYALSKTLAEKQYQEQLSAYNVSQYISLGQAYVGAIGGVVGGLASAPNDQGLSYDSPGQQFDATNPAITPTATNANLNYDIGRNTPLSSVESYNSSSFSLYGKAKGGYIPKLAGGGYFGGDSSSDKFSAMVMGGEYVVNPQTVNKYGANYFKGLNDAGKYANGGSVGISSYGGSDTSNTQMINLLTQISNKLGAGNSNVAPTATAGAQVATPSQTNHVTINLGLNQNGTTTNENSSTSSTGNSNTSAADQQNLKKIGDQLKAQTIQILTNESRPGGLLDLRFAKKTT